MTFRQTQKVLFKHCDPAGIVFFPRYFEMMNDCVEAFFDEVLGAPFETLHLTGGVPTAGIETNFRAPSRHGDRLVLELTTVHVGASSWRYHMRATCGGKLRFKTTATLVHVGPSGRAEPWPDKLRQKLTEDETKT